jgi:hypothetical protein
VPALNDAPRHADMGGGDLVPPFLTSALDGSEWLISSPGRFIPNEKTPSTQCT